MSTHKDYEDTCELVAVLGSITIQAMQRGIAMDSIIESLGAALGAAICQKHKIEVVSPAQTTARITESATNIILADKKPTAPNPSSN